MTSTVIVREQAADDIRQTSRYLGQESPAAADNFELDMIECTHRLAEHPQIGLRVRKRPTMRRVRVSERFSSWLVYYTIEDGTLHVLRVLHGARNIRALLRNMK
jgi:plasmid stabilization system protein ParE